MRTFYNILYTLLVIHLYSTTYLLTFTSDLSQKIFNLKGPLNIIIGDLIISVIFGNR